MAVVRSHDKRRFLNRAALFQSVTFVFYANRRQPKSSEKSLSQSSKKHREKNLLEAPLSLASEALIKRGWQPAALREVEITDRWKP